MRASWNPSPSLSPSLIPNPVVPEARVSAPSARPRPAAADRIDAPSPLGTKAARDTASAYVRAFGAKDARALDALTPANARFFDPTLPAAGLTKTQSDGYWRAAFAPKNELALETTPLTTRRLPDGNTEASFGWIADYELGGRPVHNEVNTKLVLSPKGELLSRTDDFDTGKWLAQAAPLGIGKLVQGVDELLGTSLSRTFAKLAVRLVLSDVLKS
jgi:hypothetical protein